MNNIKQEFLEFIEDLHVKLNEYDIDLASYPIDHICYRVTNENEFTEYSKIFSEMSVFYTTQQFRNRTFQIFMLKEPLEYKGIKIYYIEHAQPGGSDEYKKGFQHMELYTFTNLKEFSSNQKFKNDLIEKEGESYLKWKNKSVVKTTNKPIIVKAIAENEIVKVKLNK